MGIRQDQCNKVCRIIDDYLANRPRERDELIVAVRKVFKEADRKTEPQTERSGVLFRGKLEEGNYRLRKSTDGWVLQGDDTVFCGWERSE